MTKILIRKVHALSLKLHYLTVLGNKANLFPQKQISLFFIFVIGSVVVYLYTWSVRPISNIKKDFMVTGFELSCGIC